MSAADVGHKFRAEISGPGSTAFARLTVRIVAGQDRAHLRQSARSSTAVQSRHLCDSERERNFDVSMLSVGTLDWRLPSLHNSHEKSKAAEIKHSPCELALAVHR